MKKTVFTGAATALVTPMNDDYSVNYKRLEKLVDQQISDGIDALVLCGTTGEKSTLNYEDHIKVIETAAKQAAGRVPIIAGAGSNDTVYSVGLCQDAIDVGADALLMVTPYYNKTSQAGLVAHYNYVADRVDAPIIVYNVPSRTGVNIKPSTYKELSKHPNIVGIKEANGDISSVAETKMLCGDDLDIYSGNDDQTLAMLSLGAKGVISVISNILPRETHMICEEFFNGNIEASRELQLKYLSLMNSMFCDVNPIPVKDAMNILGMNVGPVRLPLIPLNDKDRNFIINELKAVGII